MRVRVATRRSNLAMEQTREVLSVLEELGHQWEIVGLDSHGDVDRKTPLHKMSRTGIFVELLNHLVASGEADIAVHSAKDMPSSLEPGLVVCHTPPRGGPWWDVMVTDSGIDGLGPGSRIGTSSIRRQKALSLWRPDLVAQDLRGQCGHQDIQDALWRGLWPHPGGGGPAEARDRCGQAQATRQHIRPTAEPGGDHSGCGQGRFPDIRGGAGPRSPIARPWSASGSSGRSPAGSGSAALSPLVYS
ncbi:hypothetical protein [Thermogymnomonas acidicola]|uniref:hypothetical protein n=1 Tax=Thermogymnomonas acidicola TaxID=399579 RepID=UPI000B1F8012|nr:hypothetical protein [Thermogymnomonas acidicola]